MYCKSSSHQGTDAATPTTVTDGGNPGNSADASVGSGKVLVGLTVHLENHTYDDAYLEAIKTYASTFASYGGKLSLEPRDEVVQFVKASSQPNFFKDLEALGHSVGSHAATGTEMGLSQTLFESKLQTFCSLFQSFMLLL